MSHRQKMPIDDHEKWNESESENVTMNVKQRMSFFLGEKSVEFYGKHVNRLDAWLDVNILSWFF